MRLTKQQYDDMLRRKPGLAPKITSSDTHKRLGTHTKLQEQKDDLSQSSNNSSKVQETYGGDNPRYKVSVTFLMSDNRRRDLDGMLATILDSICTAGRLLAGDTSVNGRRKKSL